MVHFLKFQPSSQKDKHENSEVSGLAADFPDHTEPQVSQVKQNACETINHKEVQHSDASQHDEQVLLSLCQPADFSCLKEMVN